MQRDEFQKTWGFPSEVKASIPNAHSFEVYPAPSPPSAYKSGRLRYVAAFADEFGNILATRDAMRLVSKKTGKEYDVCLRAGSPSKK
jgi:hypothetical protein